MMSWMLSSVVRNKRKKWSLEGWVPIERYNISLKVDDKERGERSLKEKNKQAS